MPGYFQKNSQILFIGQNPGQLNVRESGWDDNSYADSEDWTEFQKGYAKGLKESPIGKWVQEGLSGNVSWAFTNVIKCRTPNNGTPYLVEIERCRGYLEKQIEIIHPKVIITLGSIAFDWWDLRKNIQDVRGKRIAVFTEFYHGILIPWYHPAYQRYTHDKFSRRMLREAEIISQNEMLQREIIKFGALTTRV